MKRITLPNENVFLVIIFTLCIFATILAVCSMIGGCTPEDVQAIRKDIATLKAQASTMPSGPAKDEVNKQIEKAESLLGEWEAYVGLAAGVTGIAVGWYQRFKKGQLLTHLTNVVSSVEVIPKTESQKNEMARLQGPETTKLVHEIKNGK